MTTGDVEPLEDCHVVLKSLSDSQLSSGRQSRETPKRGLFVEELSAVTVSRNGGEQLWFLLEHPPVSRVDVVFVLEGVEVPVVDLRQKEKLVFFRAPSFESFEIADDVPLELRLSAPDLHPVSLPFTLTARTTSPQFSALLDFAATGDAQTLVQPLAAQLSLRDAEGNTVLHVAARNAQSFALQVFLSAIRTHFHNSLKKEEERRREETQLVDATNDRGQTALHCAVRAGDPDCVHYLVVHGAETSALDNHQNSVVHYLADAYNEAIFKEILEPGAQSGERDLEALNDEGLSALHLAVRRLKLALIEMLLEAGANVETRDSRGRTALSHAILMNDPEIVVFLLERGADVNNEDEEGETPLLLSKQVANYCIMGRLLDAGADPKKRTKKGVALSETDDADIQNVLNGQRVDYPSKESLAEEPPSSETVEERREETPPTPLDDGPSTSSAAASASRRFRSRLAYSKDDISSLDYLTRLRLSKLLDEDCKWKKLASELNCEHMVELIEICSVDSSPTMIFLDQFEQLQDAKISRVQDALEAMREDLAVKVIQDRMQF